MAVGRKIKSAEDWVDDGIPMLSGKPEDRQRYIRWVAKIQEDAVKCYETTATIEEVEQAFEALKVHAVDMPEAHEHALGDLEAKIRDLSKLKMPV